MYRLDLSPEEVNKILSKHVLADGYDLVLDMQKSTGVTIYDSRHQRSLLDFFSCFASVPLGYNHPKMVDDQEFLQSLLQAALTNPSNGDIYTREYAKFVDTFSKTGIPDYLPHAFFISGGGLAIENALKTAMDWKVQKNFIKGYREEKGFQVIHFTEAFHGRTGYTLSLTNTSVANKTKWFAKFDWPRIPVPKMTFPLNDEALKELVKKENAAIDLIKSTFMLQKDDVCAIIIEPVQAEGGENHVRKEFMEQLRQLCDENDALLIYDEVQTGVGLSGKFWCHEHFGENARPDIIAFGKKMQVCGILASKRIDEIEDNVFTVSSRINSTWGGNLADMVRATKILEIIEEDQLCIQAERTGNYLQQQLALLAQQENRISNIRTGKGLLTAFDLPSGAQRDQFIENGMKNGAMFLGCGERTIRFRPSLIISKAEIDKGMEILEQSMKEL